MCVCVCVCVCVCTRDLQENNCIFKRLRTYRTVTITATPGYS